MPGHGRFKSGVIALGLVAAAGAVGASAHAGEREAGPFAAFTLPDAWEARFWADPNVKALLAMDLKAAAGLVPAQAGLRFCRCPECDATEADNTLQWSLADPDVLRCRKCGVRVPNSDIPAKVDGKVPADEVEVRPGVFQKYPYHAVPAEKQAFPDERLYLAARRDYEAREWLAKVVLYAAVRYHEQPPAQRNPALARLACVLLLRFAQVYPAYAVHYDQPGQPKFFERTDQPPPYRRGFRSGKWDWMGCLDVPLNLVVAYALLRDDPALAEAGRLLGDPRPAHTIEQNFFRAAAEFVRRQPDDFEESSVYAYRGLLAVGRLLNDSPLMQDAEGRLARFTAEGFYHDGLWRSGDAATQRRVLGLLDGWIDGLVADSHGALPMLALARSASAAVLTDPQAPEVQQAAWPAPAPGPLVRQPTLLGGAGVARLAVGRGRDALDVELKGLGDLGGAHYNRLAVRVSVGGQPVLGDLDDLPPSPSGWEHSTASHNAVIVDGLNQRETPLQARRPRPGSDLLFFAADPDFQVATFDDRFAYPVSATRYRQTIVASAGARSRYAVSVFEVRGGLQHDQVFHAPAGSGAQWETSVPLAPGPATLLPPTVAYVPQARGQDGRWFVQALGALANLTHARLDRPAEARLTVAGGSGIGVRLHLLGDGPCTLYRGTAPDPLQSAASPAPRDRGVLVLRRRSEDGSTLATTFITLLEPVGPAPALKRVGRVASPAGTVVLSIETDEGREHLVVNLTPGTARTVHLADGQGLTTDGLAVRVRADGLVLAGGRVAESGSYTVRQTPAAGTIRSVLRQGTAGSLGSFETEEALPEPQTLAGRTLIVRHGDGTTHGWTIVRAQNTRQARGVLEVREEPGFTIEPPGGEAHYYQFPRITAPGPHQFRVSKVAR